MTECRLCHREIREVVEQDGLRRWWTHADTGQATCGVPGRVGLAQPSYGPMIDHIVKANKEAAVLRQRLDDLVQERDDMIREELVRGDEADRRGKASLLAKATGMHVQRIYQIRDNRR